MIPRVFSSPLDTEGAWGSPPHEARSPVTGTVSHGNSMGFKELSWGSPGLIKNGVCVWVCVCVSLLYIYIDMYIIYLYIILYIYIYINICIVYYIL